MKNPPLIENTTAKTELGWEVFRGQKEIRRGGWLKKVL